MMNRTETPFFWTELLNSNYSIGCKNLGEYNQRQDRANIRVSFNNKDYINFGDLSFASFKTNHFFIQSPEGNFICLQWMFQKIHGHIVPLLINLPDRTYHLVDPTRTLWGQKLWFSDGILCGNFTETYWTGENLQQREIKMKFLNGFNNLKSFFDLDIAKLPVKLVKWEDGIQISWIE